MNDADQDALKKALDHLRIHNVTLSTNTSAENSWDRRSTSSNCSQTQTQSAVLVDKSEGLTDNLPLSQSQQLDQLPPDLFIDWEEENGTTSTWASHPENNIASNVENLNTVDLNGVPMSINLPLPDWGPKNTLNPSNESTPPFMTDASAFGNTSHKDQHSPSEGSICIIEEGDAETESLVDQLSERIGSLQIGPGGQIRYYGATSNYNLVEMPTPDNLTVHRTVRNNGQEHLERLELGRDVPEDLENHLTNLYFAWQDPTFHAVNRKLFESAKTLWRDDKEDTPYFSEALQNSM